MNILLIFSTTFSFATLRTRQLTTLLLMKLNPIERGKALDFRTSKASKRGLSSPLSRLRFDENRDIHASFNASVSSLLIDMNKLPSIYITDYFTSPPLESVRVSSTHHRHHCHHHHHNIIKNNWSQIITNFPHKRLSLVHFCLYWSTPDVAGSIFTPLVWWWCFLLREHLLLQIFPLPVLLRFGRNCAIQRKQIQFHERLIHHFYDCCNMKLNITWYAKDFSR